MVKKVLVVDDDNEFLAELQETLKLSGYEPVVVNDSTRVADVAKRVNPDVVLMDLKMPAKSGFQVADELRHITQLSDVPIIAMTAFFKDEYVPLMNISGIKRWLKKPFHPLDIIAQIEEVLVA